MNIHCGDNLDVLRRVKGSPFQLIYNDVLYNTRKDFGAYNDNLGSPQQAVEFYRPRFIEMHRILRNTGTLWVQADYHLIHYLRVLLDGIFGFDNLVNEIIWCYTGGNASRHYKKKHDTILVYAKTKAYKFYPQRIPYTEKLLKSSLIDNDGRRYYKTGQNVSGKVYLNNDGQMLNDYWTDIPSFTSASGSHELLGYPTQKPEKLLERIILTGSDIGDYVGDFFCGSGTTVAVAKRLKRKYFGVDISSKAIDITTKRLESVC